MSFAEVRQENGYPALYIDGIRSAPLLYALTDHPLARPNTEFARKNIPYFYNAGVNIVSVCASIEKDWKEDGSYSAEYPIECIKKVKELHPTAKIYFRLNLTPPYWWMRKYPEELIKYYGVESTDTGPGRNVTEKDKTKEIRASMASERWICDVNKVLDKFCQALKVSGVGDEVVAVQVAYGTYGEWHMYGKYYGDGAYEGDYSAPMLSFFRNYLQEKYKTNEALCKAWKEDVTFEKAELATPEQRHELQDNNAYRYPECSMRAIDSLKCFQLAAPYSIAKFAKQLKESWGKGLLVGAFYGYYFGCGDVFSRMLEPHLLFDDENVDFLAAPNAYTANKFSGNAAFLRYCAESVRLNGKLFLNEMDQGYKAFYNYRGKGNVYLCENNAEYNSLVKRNVLENVLRGMGAWYFDHNHPEDFYKPVKIGYWDDPERLQAIKEIQEFTEKLPTIRQSYQSTADVLLVFDTESVYYQGIYDGPQDKHNTYNHFDFADALAKCGAAYDMIWLYDLRKCDISQYKCVLFVGCDAMRKKDCDYIRETVMSGGRTVVFMCNNGYIVDDKTSTSNITALYGFELKDGYFENQRQDCCVISVSEYRYEPNFYRELFKKAGAHIYTENEEVLCVANDLVMLHAKEKPVTTLHLKCGDITVENEKYTTKVYDNLTGQRLL